MYILDLKNPHSYKIKKSPSRGRETHPVTQLPYNGSHEGQRVCNQLIMDLLYANQHHLGCKQLGAQPFVIFCQEFNHEDKQFGY